MKKLLTILVVLLPWRARRYLLEKFWGYSLHPKSRIGLSWVFPKKMVLHEGARIGNLTVCKGLDELTMGKNGIIGNLNWITGMPSGHQLHFADQHNRKPILHIKEEAAVTNRHLIDCTDSVTIGRFATFAGFRSQILTHSIDLEKSKQMASPVEIGDFCFVGTSCVILKGSRLPDYSVLGANSVLNKKLSTPYRLYAGNPAVEKKELSGELGYFKRPVGFIS